MARRLRQGEIRWAELPRPAGRRPVLLLTRDDGLRRMSNATVAPLTRTIRGIDTEVVLSTGDGVPTECAVTLDNIATIPQSLLDERVAELGPGRMREVWAALRVAFDMP